MSEQGSPAPQVGALAPDFSSRSQHGDTITLSSFRGAASVLVMFYPFAFSGICTGELSEIAGEMEAFRRHGVEVLALSCDSMQTLRAFAEARGLDFPLVSDFWPHGAIARAYGVFDEKVGVATRGSFLIDTGGVIRWSVVHGLGEARDIDGYRQAIAAL